MALRLIDDNSVINFVDDNGLTDFVDDNGNVTFGTTYILSLAAGVLTLSGVAATLTRAIVSTYSLSPTSGALSLSGVAAALSQTIAGFKVHFRRRKV